MLSSTLLFVSLLNPCYLADSRFYAIFPIGMCICNVCIHLLTNRRNCQFPTPRSCGFPNLRYSLSACVTFSPRLHGNQSISALQYSIGFWCSRKNLCYPSSLPPYNEVYQNKKDTLTEINLCVGETVTGLRNTPARSTCTLILSLERACNCLTT